jgi:hypothetical protein
MLEGLSYDVLKELPTPVNRAPWEREEIDRMYATSFWVVPPNGTAQICPFCQTNERNHGDVTCGAVECQEKWRAER